ncbi:MAG: hypothetical protein IME99_07710 [Proteobacteria bacterium]|nr:hypothetical protein [Pseudomonadota bacterium]
MLLRCLQVVKPTLKWSAPLLLLCFIYPAIVEAGLYPVIDHPLYGIRLGEKKTILSHDIRKSGKKITRDSNLKDSVHTHGKIWSIKGALQNRKGIDHTRIHMLGGQVYEIEVVFKNHSNRKFRQIRKQLIDEFGDYDIDSTGGALFTTHIDGQNVTVRLNRISISDDGKFNITLQYFYKRFMRDVMRMHQKKMTRTPHRNSLSAR